MLFDPHLSQRTFENADLKLHSIVQYDHLQDAIPCDYALSLTLWLEFCQPPAFDLL